MHLPVNSSQPVLPYEWRNRFVSTTVHSINMWFHSYAWNGFSTKFTGYYNMRLFMSIHWLWIFKDLVTFFTFYIRWIMLLFVMIPQFNYSFDQGNLLKSIDNKNIRRLHPKIDSSFVNRHVSRSFWLNWGFVIMVHQLPLYSKM